jgi:hypothetical protein
MTTPGVTQNEFFVNYGSKRKLTLYKAVLHMNEQDKVSFTLLKVLFCKHPGEMSAHTLCLYKSKWRKVLALSH